MEEKINKNKIVSFRLEQDNYNKLKNYCDTNKESISDFLKNNVLDLIEKEKNPELRELKSAVTEFLGLYPSKYNSVLLITLLGKLSEKDVKKIINDFEFKDKLLKLIFNDLFPEIKINEINSFYDYVNEIWNKTLGGLMEVRK